MNIDNISLITISISVEDKSVLFILLAKDGSVNRSGTGKLKNKENTLFISSGYAKFYNRLIKYIPRNWSMLKGIYPIDIPEKKGSKCKLEVILTDDKDISYGFVVRYGSESSEPPHDITKLVIKAVQITEPWYKEQKRLIKKIKNEDEKNSWWKFC